MSINHLIEDHEQQNSPAPRPPKREVVWSEAHTFVASPGASEPIDLPPGADFNPYPYHLLVGIKKSDHRDFPLYRVAIGTILANGSFVPGISPRADLDQLRLGTVAGDGSFETLVRLLKAAEAWIAIDTGYAIDRFIARKGGEGRPGEGGKGGAVKTQRTGKTERDRARGKAQPKRN